MSNIALNLPDNSVRDKKVRDIFPKHLADYILKTYPYAKIIDGSYVISDLSHYRNEGNNSLIVDRQTILSFHSQNFGICCGVQLLVNFYSNSSDTKLVHDLFKVWTSNIKIPHMFILVQIIRNNKWVWRDPMYESYAKVGTLVHQWRNPLYSNHLLLMYQVTNSESFLNNLSPILMNLHKGAILG